MTLTDKLKKLLADNMVDCESHEDCVDCPLSKHITVTMPLGDVESIRKDGSWSGNMPFGKVAFQVQPCMMFSEIIRQLKLNEKKYEVEQLTVSVYFPSNEPFKVVIGRLVPGTGNIELKYDY